MGPLCDRDHNILSYVILMHAIANEIFPDKSTVDKSPEEWQAVASISRAALAMQTVDAKYEDKAKAYAVSEGLVYD